MKWALVFFVILFSTCAPALAASKQAATQPPQVIKGAAQVVDGDDLIVDGKKIRLFGVDAPAEGTKDGRVSTAALDDLVNGKSVTCTVVKFQKKHDRYVSRCAVKGAVGEEDLGREMIRQGHAWAARLVTAEYSDVERRARRDEIGFWNKPVGISESIIIALFAAGLALISSFVTTAFNAWYRRKRRWKILCRRLIHEFTNLRPNIGKAMSEIHTAINIEKSVDGAQTLRLVRLEPLLRGREVDIHADGVAEILEPPIYHSISQIDRHLNELSMAYDLFRKEASDNISRNFAVGMILGALSQLSTETDAILQALQANPD